MNHKLQTDPSSATASTVTIRSHGTGSSEPTFFSDTKISGRRGTRTQKEIEAAVYAYIRAMRTLGHTHVDSSAVAQALSLSVTDVEAAMRNLSDKGVRVIG